MLDAIKCYLKSYNIAGNNMLKDAFWSEKYVKGDNGLPKSLYNQERIIKSFRGKKKSGYLITRCTLQRYPSASGL